MPTRNRAVLLERAARSVLAQRGVELELVISDNASTDGTATLCAELATADPRVRVITQATDIGAEGNFRTVLEAASGPLFMWLADDDWIDPDYLSACASVLDRCPDHIVVCGRGRYYRAGTLAFVQPPVNLLSNSANSRLLGYYRTVIMNEPFYGVIRRELLLPLPFQHTVGSDWLLVAALAYSGKIRTIEDYLLHPSEPNEGASRDHESLGRAYGLSSRQAKYWYLVVAQKVFRDIREATAYPGMGNATRNAVAVVAAAVVAGRWGRKAISDRGLVSHGLSRGSHRLLERRRG